ncbi:hypothetical protein EE612_043505 [Oryza sativa]|nr:hypothetical protein EE612_043505 [Oryza sativa]
MARRRVSAGAASTPIHQIGIQGRTTKALHGCSVVIKSSTSVVGPYAWVRSGGRNKLSVQTIGPKEGRGALRVGPTSVAQCREEEDAVARLSPGRPGSLWRGHGGEAVAGRWQPATGGKVRASYGDGQDGRSTLHRALVGGRRNEQ